jgi:hypothetical protein
MKFLFIAIFSQFSIIKSYVLEIRCKSRNAVDRKLHCDNIEKESELTAEKLRIASILRHQGLTFDDLKSLRESVNSGKRYNKQVPYSGSTLIAEDSTKKKSSHIDNLTSPSSSSVSSIIDNNEVNTKPEKQSTIESKSEKNKYLNEKAQEFLVKSSLLKEEEIKVKPKKPVITLKNLKSVSLINSSDKEEVKYKEPLFTPKHVNSDGVKLETMLNDLINQYGYEYLYEATSLRCFSIKPTIVSSLKVLRKDDMLWARKKIEYLYFEMKKNESKK